ncbi:hypothetical protein BDQ17DRAFT_1414914 [Cyathus striatus]|nr:hypothetical protein BDQ17DRAFT_1414914 [Cyathus striatus]
MRLRSASLFSLLPHRAINISWRYLAGACVAPSPLFTWPRHQFDPPFIGQRFLSVVPPNVIGLPSTHAKGGYIYSQTVAILVRPFPTPQPPSPLPIPHEFTISEIHCYLNQFAVAAKNAIRAGIDGIEIHGENGYLIDQFLQDMSNTRSDAYGGSVGKRSRFALEVTKAVVDAVGEERFRFRFDLPRRLEENLPLNKYGRTRLYIPAELPEPERGCIDYLFYAESGVLASTLADVDSAGHCA